MRKFLALCLLVCALGALSAPVRAGVIHQPGEPQPEAWMEADCNVWQWDFRSEQWVIVARQCN